uniref:Uncharacterized protein n=1 Tax=Anguilla anguilla TaxID=7936 RepID=A0A0E9UGU9_ANGAN
MCFTYRPTHRYGKVSHFICIVYTIWL